mmetsp:Transcript_115613/g.274781  ORF Transcript_115613/g.274781 Transcript_115613/m.274781 type:complete len:250 (+) Transcript_115613:767-1516(+)
MARASQQSPKACFKLKAFSSRIRSSTLLNRSSTRGRCVSPAGAGGGGTFSSSFFRFWSSSRSAAEFGAASNFVSARLTAFLTQSIRRCTDSPAGKRSSAGLCALGHLQFPLHSLQAPRGVSRAASLNCDPASQRGRTSSASAERALRFSMASGHMRRLNGLSINRTAPKDARDCPKRSKECFCRSFSFSAAWMLSASSCASRRSPISTLLSNFSSGGGSPPSSLSLISRSLASFAFVSRIFFISLQLWT